MLCACQSLISIFDIVFFMLYFVSFHFCVVLLLLRTFVAFINKIIVIVNNAETTHKPQQQACKPASALPVAYA